MVRRKQTAAAVATVMSFDDNRLARDLFGAGDAHLRLLEQQLGIGIDVRGATLQLRGAKAAVADGERILNQLYALLKRGTPVIESDVERAYHLFSRDRNADIESLFAESILLPAKQRVIIPRSPAQKAYLEDMRRSDIVFSIGPAGTGKSYLAVAMAVACLLKREVRRIVLSRPAVEAGERLGFLPGTMEEKVHPFLRPLYDALYDMLDVDRVHAMLEEDVIEIAPLAFMRGRTLHHSFIILDEAQNASYHQMKMCLTRMGTESRMVVTGDVTQSDLPPGERSGILEAWRILEGCPGIAFHRFTERDVVRHPLVGEIVTAYQRDEARHA